MGTKEQTAAQLLHAGASTSDVVARTGLTLHEVSKIAANRPGGPVGVPHPAPDTLDTLMRQVAAQAARTTTYPAKACRLLNRAADLVAAAQVAVVEDAGKAAKRSEIAKLEAKVRALKAELKGAPAPGAPTGQRNWKQIRAWARDNGYDVGDVGRPKQAIVDAYDAAQAVA